MQAAAAAGLTDNNNFIVIIINKPIIQASDLFSHSWNRLYLHSVSFKFVRLKKKKTLSISLF